jgi:uncharacterized membrane protein YfcA
MKAKFITENKDRSATESLDSVTNHELETPFISEYPDNNLTEEVLDLISKDNYLIEKSANKFFGEINWKKITRYSLYLFAALLIGHFIYSYTPWQVAAFKVRDWYGLLDKNFHWMVLAGFLAQMVDGALGMGYGVTSAAVLLSTGINATTISGSIHTAEVFASGASGYSHFKFGNVNMKLFKTLVIPGVIGAIAGAILLVILGNKYGDYIRPVLAVYMLFLGIKFIMNGLKSQIVKKKFTKYRLLAAIGGFCDSFAGGGWGPLVTSTLINKGRSHKYVVGSVSLTEFFVTLVSALSFFVLLGVSHWQVIVALMIGGVIAAPIAAKLAGKLPRKTAYILLGVLVIFWSIRILVKTV